MSKHINVRARAEAEYRSSFRALSLLIRDLELRALNAALGRFVAASNSLALTRPEQVGAKYTVQRVMTRTNDVTLCVSCGLPVPTKARQHGPRQLYCSTKCRNREYKQRYRRKKAAA